MDKEGKICNKRRALIFSFLLSSHSRPSYLSIPPPVRSVISEDPAQGGNVRLELLIRFIITPDENYGLIYTEEELFMHGGGSGGAKGKGRQSGRSVEVVVDEKLRRWWC